MILIVEDEPSYVDALELALHREGFATTVATDGPSALVRFDEAHPDLVLLDLMLPGMSGVDVCREIRSRSRTPVIMVTAKDSELDTVVGLEVGADDYLTKPFSPQELVLRVGAILRRVAQAPQQAADILRVGTLQIDRGAHRVAVDGHDVELTPTEYRLLVTLAERRGRVQARGHLLETVWEAAPDIQTRTVDMHVQRLRTKLGGAGDLIETVRGFGYRLRAAGQSRSA